MTSHAGVVVVGASAAGLSVAETLRRDGFEVGHGWAQAFLHELQVHGLLSKHNIEGTIGSGGPSLQLTTSNGGIRILKL